MISDFHKRWSRTIDNYSFDIGKRTHTSACREQHVYMRHGAVCNLCHTQDQSGSLIKPPCECVCTHTHTHNRVGVSGWTCRIDGLMDGRIALKWLPRTPVDITTPYQGGFAQLCHFRGSADRSRHKRPVPAEDDNISFLWVKSNMLKCALRGGENWLPS